MKFVRIAFFLCALSASAFTINAQRELPKSQAEIERMAALRPVNPVAPLSDGVKIRQIQLLTKETIDPAITHSLFSPIKLDVHNSYVDGKASVRYEIPLVVDPQRNRVSFYPFTGGGSGVPHLPRLAIFFNVPEPGYYVFDFSIANANARLTSGGRMLFILATASGDIERGERQNNPLGTDPEHQIFLTNIKTTGWRLILLESPTDDWDFYSVEISRFR